MEPFLCRRWEGLPPALWSYYNRAAVTPKNGSGTKIVFTEGSPCLADQKCLFFFAADADERINLQHILKLMIYGRSKQHLCLFSYSSLVPPCNILNFYLWCLLKQNHVRNISTFTAHGERAECKKMCIPMRFLCKCAVIFHQGTIKRGFLSLCLSMKEYSNVNKLHVHNSKALFLFSTIS